MMKAGKRRIDQLLVERGIVESRQRAQALILAGQVLANEQKIEKPGQAVDLNAAIRLLGQLPFVSRGGIKLMAALDHFQIRVEGRICADLGASTGGFTDCLLQRGACAVHAFDVGKALLDWRLRTDKRVVVHDEFNVRTLLAQDLPAGVSLITIDLSFISLTKILVPLRDALRKRYLSDHAGPDLNFADVIALVKPQFEVGKGEVGKGGIVRDPQKRLHALQSTIEFAGNAGYQVVGHLPSPIPGAKGNQEFLLYLRLFSDL
jgi:23S rRNA (cytidine1920-2'-O)/16S rRNA (cytidine1409-2'-O)-methyltransferase